MIFRVSSIQDLYNYIGLKRNPVYEDYDVLTHQETYPDTQKLVPPHRRDFYSIIFLENQEKGKMSINQDSYQNQENVVFFQSPDHIFSFVRGEAMRGFIIFFKPEFLLPICSDVSDVYSYFRVDSNNLFNLESDEKEEFMRFYTQISKEKGNRLVSKYLLLAFLEKVNILQEKKQGNIKNRSKEEELSHSFKRLLNNYFIEEKSVAFYASRLHVTPNYLNAKIKSITGKSVKTHIAERVVLEAKNLLTYTDYDIAEISHLLQFNDPSYFGRFFKNHSGFTPKAFREKR